jgi:hypothetical protein
LELLKTGLLALADYRRAASRSRRVYSIAIGIRLAIAKALSLLLFTNWLNRHVGFGMNHV